MDKQQSTAILRLLLGASLISFSAVFVKVMDVAPTPSAFYRVLIGGLILLSVSLIRYTKFLRDLRFLGLAFVCGLLFASDLGMWHQSILYVGPGLATILGNFQVFFLALFGILIYKEQITVRLGMSFVLAVFGLFLIFGLDWNQLGTHYKLGILLGIGTALSYAGYVLVLRKLQSNLRGHSSVTILAVVSLATALFLGVLGLIQGQSFAVPNPTDWGYLGTYAVFSQVLGWILISKALPAIDVSRAGLILLLQPGLAFVWDILFFQRPTQWIEIIGAGIALTAIYLGTISKSDSAVKKAEN